jgi:hypothetical protein
VRIFGPHKHSKVSDVFGQVITHILAHFGHLLELTKYFFFF